MVCNQKKNWNKKRRESKINAFFLLVVATATLIILISPFSVATPTYQFCDYPLAQIETPCTMLTPLVSNCAAYTYNITMLNTTKVVEDGILTYFADNQYYFNFTEGNGDYSITLCDGTSKQVKVKNKEVDYTMLTTVFGLGIMMAFFIFLGVKANNRLVKYLFYFLAACEGVVLLAVSYADNLGVNPTAVIQANFWIVLILFAGIVILSLFVKSGELATDDIVKKPKSGPWSKIW